MELRRAALAALLITEPQAKARAIATLWNERAACLPDPGATLEEPAAVPGRPVKPSLVDPRSVPQRATSTSEGRARLLHAVAHIEFNAINLALDACWRFTGMPAQYYVDWLQVASEEAYHHRLVCEHLSSLGWQYGDFDAHDGLWQMAERTRHDVLARMALVPRILEARGLDVTPAMQQRMAQSKDHRAVEILGIILRDEVGHVAIGNHWYQWLCKQRGEAPIPKMQALMLEHDAPRIKPPLNMAARRQAGFSQAELESLLLAPGSATSRTR